MIQTNWPSWHSDTELGAENLRGLEDYLLARAQILDENAFGVDQLLDWTESIQFEWVEQTGKLTVQNVRGVTPGGQPVWLGERDDVLSWETSEVVHGSDFRPGTEIDIWITVNYNASGSKKLTLTPSVALTLPVHDSGALDSLYLGRYLLPYPDFAGSAGLKLMVRPIPRRLCAFTDASWKEWAKPLPDKIDSLVAAAQRDSERNLARLALNVELMRLRFEWPFLPLPLLVRRLHMIGCLTACNEASDSQVDLSRMLVPFSLEDVTGNSLPQDLANLLPEPQIKVIGLAPSLERLFELLKSPVAFHAPIGLLSQWYEELKLCRSRGLSGPEQTDVTNLIQSARKSNDWSVAVAQMTAMSLNLLASGGDVVSEATLHFDRLYNSNATKGPSAGPMVFYWLAKCGELQSEFPKRGSAALSQYFSTLRGGRPTASANTDRLYRYLVGRGDPSKVVDPPMAPYLWWANGARRVRYDPAISCRIVIVGKRGSGKKTLSKALSDAASNADLRVTVEIQDIRPGGLQSDEFQGERRSILLDAHLIVFAIEPSDTDSSEMSKTLSDLALSVLPENPEAVFAITYTRADEYGVVEPGALRFAEGQGPAERLRALQRTAHEERDWNAFVDSSRDTGDQRIKGTSWSMPGLRASVGESFELRKRLLINTKPLWLIILKSEAALLNGYFVSASPKEALLSRSGAYPGVRHLIVDFGLCIKSGSV